MGRALAILLFLSSAAGAQEVEKVKAIVDKAVAAHGGADKLLRTFRWKERYQFGGDEKKGTVREARLDPPDAWWAGPRNIAAGNKDRSDKTYLVWAWTLVPLTEKDSRLALLPDVEVAARPAAGIRLSREGRADLSLYFDKETGRLARIDWRAYHCTFDTWKEVDGARYPARAEVRRKDGSLHLVTEFLELERVKTTPGEK